MAWTSPTTWVAGDPLTADRLNTELNDKLEALYNYINSYTILRDEKSAGANAGAFTAGAWQTRVLNTKVGDNLNSVTLNTSTNTFTLIPGTYIIRASAPAHAVNSHQIRLQDITNSSTIEQGTSEWSDNGNGVNARSFLSTILSIASSTAFQIQHRCSVSKTINGLGPAANFTTEVYTEVEIWRVD